MEYVEMEKTCTLARAFREQFWNQGLLECISSILEQTSLNFGFFIQWQHMDNLFFLNLFLVANSYEPLAVSVSV